MTSIAKQIGVSIGSLDVWLKLDPERSARAREAREATARLWDERAEMRIDDAKDPFELARAKELAHHYRWRAAKIAPREYGDKIDVTHGGTLDIRKVPTDELRSELAGLLAAAAIDRDRTRAGEARSETQD